MANTLSNFCRTSGRNQDYLGVVRERLWNTLETSHTWTENGNHRFLPTSALTECLPVETINMVLQQKRETNHINSEEITGKKRRLKILAILLLMNNTEHIGHLIQKGVSDDDLPLKSACLKTCLGFKDNSVEVFEHYQYRVHVPVWDFTAPGIEIERYEDDQKLPFLEKVILSRGGQGLVWKIEIHRDHFKTNVQSVS